MIIGPYNKDGELWTCDQHDVCNGVTLEDGSYAYVLTSTFPYYVGCWGPGPKQIRSVDCSDNDCGLGALSSIVFTATTLLVAVSTLLL